MQQLIDTVKAAGATVLTDDIYYVDGGSIFSKKVSLEERRAIVEWCEGVQEKIK